LSIYNTPKNFVQIIVLPVAFRINTTYTTIKLQKNKVVFGYKWLFKVLIMVFFENPF